MTTLRRGMLVCLRKIASAAATEPSRRWWYLDKHGKPASEAWLRRVREEAIAAGEEVAHHDGDYGTPWVRSASHLHGKNGVGGIHYYGTLEEARAELARARAGLSKLPVG